METAAYVTAVVLTQGSSEPEMAFSAFTKHAVSRSGAAVCGVIGFHHHVGVWPALLGAVGWLIAFDHVGYLLRRPSCGLIGKIPEVSGQATVPGGACGAG